MICDKCHNTIEAGAVFCNKCGNQLQNNNAFNSQSITENTTFMQADTQNDNIQTIKSFLNEEIPESQTKIPATFSDNTPEDTTLNDMPEDFNDSISFEDTREIEIPKNITEIDLTAMVNASLNENISSEKNESAESVITNENSISSNDLIYKNTDCDINNDSEDIQAQPRDFACDTELDTLNTAPTQEPVSSADSPFKISVSADENEIPQDFPSSPLPSIKNPNIPASPIFTTQNLYSQNNDIDVLELVVMLLFALVPVIGLIYHLFFAFGQDKSIIKQKVSKAVLLTYIFIGLMALMFFVGFALGIL